jgi:cysteine desulfurase
MHNAEKYFDHAATTPVDPRVRDAMLPYLDFAFGNPNSLHDQGRQAAWAIDEATWQLAALLEIAPEQLYFTSGATESNNWVLKAGATWTISPFEHSAMREPALATGARQLANRGENLEPAQHETDGLSVMSVNNETGTRWDVRELRGVARILHSDITQSVGKLPLALEEIDYASLSAHKFYGPKGVGALYCRDTPPPPMIRGGEQQHGARGGTLNVPAIVGMGLAAQIALENMETDYEQATLLNELVRDELRKSTDWQVNGGVECSPYILSLSFLGIEGETLVVELDRAGFGVSAGAACSSRSTEPSHVLTALGLLPAWRRGTIRVSFGRSNTLEATRQLAREIAGIVEKLRTI